MNLILKSFALVVFLVGVAISDPILHGNLIETLSQKDVEWTQAVRSLPREAINEETVLVLRNARRDFPLSTETGKRLKVAERFIEEQIRQQTLSSKFWSGEYALGSSLLAAGFWEEADLYFLEAATDSKIARFTRHDSLRLSAMIDLVYRNRRDLARVKLLKILSEDSGHQYTINTFKGWFPEEALPVGPMRYPAATLPDARLLPTEIEANSRYEIK